MAQDEFAAPKRSRLIAAVTRIGPADSGLDDLREVASAMPERAVPVPPAAEPENAEAIVGPLAPHPGVTERPS